MLRRDQGNGFRQSGREAHFDQLRRTPNLTMRMGMRHCTRLTNGFSKKVENHAHALAIYFMHYNFARIHSSLRVSPAMAAGGTDKLWSLEDVAALVRSKRAAAEETRPLQKASSKLTHYLSGQYILRDQHLFTTRCE